MALELPDPLAPNQRCGRCRCRARTWHSSSLAELTPSPFPAAVAGRASHNNVRSAGRALQRARRARAPLDPQLNAPSVPPSPSRGASRSCAFSCKSSTCPSLSSRSNSPQSQTTDPRPHSPMRCDIRSTPLRRRSGDSGRHCFTTVGPLPSPPSPPPWSHTRDCTAPDLHPFETKRRAKALQKRGVVIPGAPGY